MNEEQKIKELLCDIGRRVYDRNMIAANDGNFSVKLKDGTFLCTPTGVSKGFMTPEMICKIDANGEVLEANKSWKPSTEMKMHMRIYERRADVGAIVHAHPQYATAHAVAGIPLNKNIMPEAVIFLGEVPIAPYGLPSTMEIPDALEPYFKDYNAVLLENHGALAWGSDLMNAYFLMEGLEFYASVMYKARMLCDTKELTPDKEIAPHEVERLRELRSKYEAVRKQSGVLNAQS